MMRNEKPYKLAKDAQPCGGPYISPSELSRLSGVSRHTLKRMVNLGAMPRPVMKDEHDRPLFDLGDPKLKQWLEAIKEAARDGNS